MKIRLVSDLHIDINQTMEFGFSKKDDVDLIIIAGDIAGDYQNEEKFLKSIDSKFVAVAGNHLGYDFYRYPKEFEQLALKENQLEYLTNRFEGYLHDSYLEVEDYIIFGGTMYSNMSLFRPKSTCKMIGERWLNDFRYVFTANTGKRIKDQNVRTITTDDYEKWFRVFKKKLTQCIEDHPLKKVVVVTHFAPSIKSIRSEYLNSRCTFTSPGHWLSACYASNMEKFIKDHPNIVLWTHGHVHSSFDYNIGNCRVVCEPYGYRQETHLSPEKYVGKIINLDTIS